MPITTAFQAVPYNAAGDTFILSAKDVSTQRTLNMYAVPSPNSQTSPAVLKSFPGLKLWSTGTALESDRGVHKNKFDGKLWKVSGNRLYSVDSSGTQTDQGFISGSDLVSFADNGVTLLICANNILYSHDKTTLSTLSVSFTPIQVDYLNERFVVLADDGFIHLSSANSTTFGVETPFNAKSSPDETIGIKVFDQFLFVGGTSTFEPWQDLGQGNPPFARVNGVIIEEVGLANKNCFAVTPQALYFLGADKNPYKIYSFQAIQITENNQGVSEIFQTYTKETAFVESFRIDGQDIVLFNFPTEEKVWCYSALTNLWFELDHNVNGSYYLGKTFVRMFNKTLVGDRSNGNIYELDPDTYQNNSVGMARERIFRPISGELLGVPRARLQGKMVRFAVETGVGDGDDNPQMVASWSTDGGRSYSNPRSISLGQEGDYLDEVSTYFNTKFTDFVLKVRYTENTRFSLYGSAMYVREAGKS